MTYTPISQLTVKKPTRLRPVTGRQMLALTYIRRYSATYYCSPTIREICEYMTIGHAQGGVRHLQALVRKGMVLPVIGGNGCHRGYRLTEAGQLATADQDLSPLPAAEYRRKSSGLRLEA